MMLRNHFLQCDQEQFYSRICFKRFHANSEAFKFEGAFSKTDTSKRCDGFFMETFFQDMQEAKDFESVENVSPLRADITDKCCPQSNEHQ